MDVGGDMCIKTLDQFNEALKEFTNTPLFNGFYNKNSDCLYRYMWDYIQSHSDYFANCLYSGVVYRVLACHKSEVNYDGFITHWSADIDAFVIGSLDRGCFDSCRRYCWLTAEIINGFFVNSYTYEGHNYFIEYEYEVLFPMSRENVVDVFYGTYAEFQTHRKKRFS